MFLPNSPQTGSSRYWASLLTNRRVRLLMVNGGLGRACDALKSAQAVGFAMLGARKHWRPRSAYMENQESTCTVY